MAKPQTAQLTRVIEPGFVEDKRGLPMYAANGDDEHPETFNREVRGYHVFAEWLPGERKPFSVIVVKLTKPTLAKVGGKKGELREIPAGEHIYVPGAYLDDLCARALDPLNVYEYIMKPQAKRMLLDNGNKMVVWDRDRAKTPANRAEICKETIYEKAMTPAEFITARALKAREMDSGAPDFNPEEYEQSARTGQ